MKKSSTEYTYFSATFNVLIFSYIYENSCLENFGFFRLQCGLNRIFLIELKRKPL